MTSAEELLRRLLEVLEARGWRLVRRAKRFFVYGPPTAEATSDDYELLVPRDPGQKEFGRAFEASVSGLASYLGMPFTSIEALLVPASEIVSMRLHGADFEGGAAPFLQFERVLEHFKRAISRAASFVATDDPLGTATPSAARKYVEGCWFMQTARGSFVTRVAIPVLGTLGETQLSLFRRPVECAQVARTLREVGKLVATQILENESAAFTPQGFALVRDVLSVTVLDEYASLLRASGASAIDMTFQRQDMERESFEMRDLSESRLEALDRYIDFARAELRERFELRCEGQVFDLRRSKRGRRTNHVGVVATVEGRAQDITFKVSKSDLPFFMEAFKTGQRVRVAGVARRMRTQLRLEDDLEFQIVGGARQGRQPDAS